MNDYHVKLLSLLDEIECHGLSRENALSLILAGELSRLNDGIDYLKRAAGNIDETLTRMEHAQ